MYVCTNVLVWMYACIHMYERAYVCVLRQPQCCRNTPPTPALPIERLSCLEGKVCDLQCDHDSHRVAMQGIQGGQDSQNAAIKDFQGQGSLCQRTDRVETQSRGRLGGN